MKILTKLSSTILVVDDYEPFRRVVCQTLGEESKYLVVGQASDGQEALRKAAELQPDLVLLDITLPILHGIAVARRMRDFSPESKVLFLSQESDADVVREALNLGFAGYVAKADAGRELCTAIEVALLGKQFVSSALGALDPRLPGSEQKDNHNRRGHHRRKDSTMRLRRASICPKPDSKNAPCYPAHADFTF
jgi:DNA-binding NarL/FixJ family response regulator